LSLEAYFLTRFDTGVTEEVPEVSPEDSCGDGSSQIEVVAIPERFVVGFPRGRDADAQSVSDTLPRFVFAVSKPEHVRMSRRESRR